VLTQKKIKVIHLLPENQYRLINDFPFIGIRFSEIPSNALTLQDLFFEL
jgi:hypothetical protein